MQGFLAIPPLKSTSPSDRGKAHSSESEIDEHGKPLERINSQQSSFSWEILISQTHNIDCIAGKYSEFEYLVIHFDNVIFLYILKI